MKATAAALSLLVKQNELPEVMLGQEMKVVGFNIPTAERSVPYSDVITSQMLKEHYGGMLTFIPAEERWYVWNGKIHEPVDKLGGKDTFSTSLATDISYALRDALSFTEEQCIAQLPTVTTGNTVVTPQQQYANLFKKQRAYRDAVFMTRGLSSLARQLEHVFSASEDTFTEDRQWLVVENGVFNLYEIEAQVRALKPGEPFPRPTLYPHDAELPVARYIRAEWAPGASRAEWAKFLEQSIPDEGTRKYLQVLTGAAFSGWDKPKTIPNLQGPKDSGKTVFVKTLAQLGSGGMKYADEVTPDVLMQNQKSDYNRANLRGLRFVAMSEPSLDTKLDGAFVKRLTGGDAVETRGIREKPISWQPQCVIFVASNDPVKFQSRDTALLDRVKLLNFPHQHWSREEKPDTLHVKDPMLEWNLKRESSGILSWIMLGMMEFFQLNREVVPPAAAVANREQLRVSGSVVQRWLSDMVELGLVIKVPDAQRADIPRRDYVLRTDAWVCFKSWMADAEERFSGGKNTFYQELYSEFPAERVPGGAESCLYGLLASDAWRQAKANANGWAIVRS